MDRYGTSRPMTDARALSNHRSQFAFDVEQILSGPLPKFIRPEFSRASTVCADSPIGNKLLESHSYRGNALTTFIIMAVMGFAPYWYLSASRDALN
jgi:hypothetical protein